MSHRGDRKCKDREDGMTGPVQAAEVKMATLAGE